MQLIIGKVDMIRPNEGGNCLKAGVTAVTAAKTARSLLWSSAAGTTCSPTNEAQALFAVGAAPAEARSSTFKAARCGSAAEAGMAAFHRLHGQTHFEHS